MTFGQCCPGVAEQRRHNQCIYSRLWFIKDSTIRYFHRRALGESETAIESGRIVELTGLDTAKYYPDLLRRVRAASERTFGMNFTETGNVRSWEDGTTRANLIITRGYYRISISDTALIKQALGDGEEMPESLK